MRLSGDDLCGYWLIGYIRPCHGRILCSFSTRRYHRTICGLRCHVRGISNYQRYADDLLHRQSTNWLEAYYSSRSAKWQYTSISRIFHLHQRIIYRRNAQPNIHQWRSIGGFWSRESQLSCDHSRGTTNTQCLGRERTQFTIRIHRCGRYHLHPCYGRRYHSASNLHDYLPTWIVILLLLASHLPQRHYHWWVPRGFNGVWLHTAIWYTRVAYHHLRFRPPVATSQRGYLLRRDQWSSSNYNSLDSHCRRPDICLGIWYPYDHCS